MEALVNHPQQHVGRIGLGEEMFYPSTGGTGNAVIGLEAAGGNDADTGVMRWRARMSVAPSNTGIIMSVRTNAISSRCNA
jgi:hypothetical protein